ncbi:MAG: hypothetical protein ACRYHQ_29745 [Janthinobacterium lividum]
MSKPLALAAAVLLGSVTLAAAQPAPPPAPSVGPPGAPPAGQDSPAPDPMRERMHDGMHGEGRGGMMGQRMGMMHGMMGGGMRGPRGAHFVFEREGASIDLRCADNESTRACVDAAAVLLDKLGSQPAR